MFSIREIRWPLADAGSRCCKIGSLSWRMNIIRSQDHSASARVLQTGRPELSSGELQEGGQYISRNLCPIFYHSISAGPRNDHLNTFQPFNHFRRFPKALQRSGSNKDTKCNPCKRTRWSFLEKILGVRSYYELIGRRLTSWFFVFPLCSAFLEGDLAASK